MQTALEPPECQPRFLKTRPVRVVVGAAGFAVVAFFASPLAVPLVNDASPFLLAAAVAGLEAVFLTTVLVLPSLASLPALIRRPVRVAGLEGGALGAGAAAARRVRVAGAGAPAELELAFDVAVTFLTPVAARDDLAFSTMLESKLVAAAERDTPVPLRGDPGLAICDFMGDTGRPLFNRELDEVGDKTCPGRTGAPSGTCARVLFLGCSMFSMSFSLS